MKINKTRHKSNGTISRRKYKKIHKSRKQLKRTHKKSLLRLKKYNKNNRYRRHYTRKVNRSRRGGVPLPQISKPFNFSFPDEYNDGAYNVVAAGWGYVTKLNSVFSQKNRPEQLIVYKNNDDNKNYIARCTFKNCEIKKGALTETNMEESIQVENITVTLDSDSILLANVRSFDKKVYTIKPSINKNANIRIKNTDIPNLFEYFSNLVVTPPTSTAAQPSVDPTAAIESSLDNTACIEFLQNCRMKPELLGKLYSLSDTTIRNMVSKIISEHIFPLETLLTRDDAQKSGEKQFSKVLYNLCFSEICNPYDIKMTLRQNFLFVSLFRIYFEKYKVIEAIGVEDFLKSITDTSNIDEIVETIMGIVNLKMNDLPIGIKCVFKAIKDGFKFLESHKDREKLTMTWVTQCLNVLYLRIITPYITLYEKPKFVYISQKLMKTVNGLNKEATQAMKDHIKTGIDIVNQMELNCDNSDIDIDIEFLKGLPYGNVNPKDCDDFIKLCKTNGIEFPTASQPT